MVQARTFETYSKMKICSIPPTNRRQLTVLVPGLTIASQTWAQQGSRYYHGHMWDGGWYGWVFGPMMMILFVALIVIAVVLTVRWLGGGDLGDSGRSGPSSGSSDRVPLDILKERYARGEIDKEEFEERRRTLEK